MSENYKDDYYGSILDPIHGDIKLSEIEKWCISHPLFARLRKVKQNTFLYYVFPSALHTRFEHSIGVMHIAGKIFDSCKENYATGKKKNEKYSENSGSSFFDLLNLKEKEKIYYQELRLAALLHDIGHGPLSHLFDNFIMSKKSFINLVKNSIPNHKSNFETLLSQKKHIEHEHISSIFIFKIISELKQESKNNINKFSDTTKETIKQISFERIIKLVEFDFKLKDDDGFIDANNNDYSNFFSKIISSFPLDSDRMDYLLRDSYFSGVNYGFYDVNRIFSSFMAIQENKQIYLVIKESGLDSVLRFIQSRTHLFNQIYYHKTNRAANTMLSAATRSSSEKKIKIVDNINLDELQNFYVKNSDEFFLNKTANKLTVNKNEREILKELKNRRLFKRLFEHKIVLNPKNFDKKSLIEKIVKKIKIKLQKLEAKSIFSYVDMFTNETFKDSGDKSIKIAKKDKITGKYAFGKDWRSINLEFENSNLTSIMIRIYSRRTFQNSSEFKSNRKRLLETEIKSELDKILEIKND